MGSVESLELGFQKLETYLKETEIFIRPSKLTFRSVFGSGGGQPSEVTGKVRCKSGAVPQL
jgi:hypothetical protein